MSKRGSIALFIAATTLLAITTAESNNVKAEENDLGGLKEWNTDMSVDADFILDNDAQKLADEAAKSSTCIPIGEGENCW
tara:strand:- start:463 stop:702 length:240 start_codon:yes stop_codon:yes gene_type:complete